MTQYVNPTLMKNFKIPALLLIWISIACSSKAIPQKSDGSLAHAHEGYALVWQDEFETDGKPNSDFWSYEEGLVRNNELQYYQAENANVKDGYLIIEGKRERIRNKAFEAGHSDWRKNTEHAEYSAASIHTRGKKTFQYGIFEIRARIDTALGMWPAIWTLGISKPWPANGEIDIMEFYRVAGEPTILANAAWASESKRAEWDEAKIHLGLFLKKDPEWAEKFHVWRMDWSVDAIKLYLDGELLNEIDLSKTLNPDDFNPFHQPHYLLLNLAIGSNGGDPAATSFPRKYELDYVRVYQKQ